MNSALVTLRRRLLIRARERAAYWRTKKKKAKKGTRAYSRAAHMLDKREKQVKHRIALLEEAVEAATPKTLSTSAKALEMIKEFEGYSQYRYDDGVGVQTIGYGTTSADIDPLPKRVSKAEAEALLKKSLADKYEPAVRKSAERNKTKWTQSEFDALVSFVYNLGPGAVLGAQGFDTLTKALASRDRKRIAASFELYSNPGNPNVHKGLLRRRKAEAELFLGRYG